MPSPIRRPRSFRSDALFPWIVVALLLATLLPVAHAEWVPVGPPSVGWDARIWGPTDSDDVLFLERDGYESALGQDGTGQTFGLARSEDGGESWTVVDGVRTVKDLAIDPTNPARVYAAVHLEDSSEWPRSTLLVSDDYGRTWTEHPLDPVQFDGCHIESLWPSSTPGGPLFAMTFTNSDNSVPLYLARSDDQGQSWEFLIRSLRSGCAEPVDDPTPGKQANRAGAAGAGPAYGGHGLPGVADDGDLNEYNLSFYSGLYFHPDDPHVLFMGGAIGSTIQGNYEYSSLFRSDDGGYTWAPLADTTAAIHYPALGEQYPLIIDSTDPDKMISGRYTFESGDGGVISNYEMLFSVDGGASWTVTPSPLDAAGDNNKWSPRILPGHDCSLYTVTEAGIHRGVFSFPPGGPGGSGGGGLADPGINWTWTLIADGSSDYPPTQDGGGHRVNGAAVWNDGDGIAVSLYGSTWLSRDQGESWTPFFPMDPNEEARIQLDTDDVQVVREYDGFRYLMTDGDLWYGRGGDNQIPSWQHLGSGFNGAISRAEVGHLARWRYRFSESPDLSWDPEHFPLQISTDYANSWTTVPGVDGRWVRQVVWDAVEGDWLWLVGEMAEDQSGIYRSTDAGQSWELVRDPQDYRDSRLTAVPDRRGGLFLNQSGRIYSTVDGGESWDFITDRSGESVQLYASVRNYVLLQSRISVELSSDGGGEFEGANIDSDYGILPSETRLFGNTIFALDKNNDYAGQHYPPLDLYTYIPSGTAIPSVLYKLHTGNDSLHYTGMELPAQTMDDLHSSWFHGNGLMLRSYGGWRQWQGDEEIPRTTIFPPEDRPDPKPAPVNGRFTLGPAYPNPFNDVTRAQVYLPESRYVRVMLTNIEGRIVERLMDNRRMSRGWNELFIDSGNLASGTYFLHVWVYSTPTDPFYTTLTQRLTLLR